MTNNLLKSHKKVEKQNYLKNWSISLEEKKTKIWCNIHENHGKLLEARVELEYEPSYKRPVVGWSNSPTSGWMHRLIHSFSRVSLNNNNNDGEQLLLCTVLCLPKMPFWNLKPQCDGSWSKSLKHINVLMILVPIK